MFFDWDKYKGLWRNTLEEQASDLEPPYAFVNKVVTYGFAFHTAAGNIICDYTLNGKTHNILYIFLKRRSVAYHSQNLMALSNVATGTYDAANALMEKLDKFTLPKPIGATIDHFHYLHLDILFHNNHLHLVDALLEFLSSIKGRNHEMTADQFLEDCHVNTISELTPEELVDFSYRFIDTSSSVHLKQLAGNLYGDPGWDRVATLIEEAYEKRLSFKTEFIITPDIFPLPNDYEPPMDGYGLKYRLVGK